MEEDETQELRGSHEHSRLTWHGFSCSCVAELDAGADTRRGEPRWGMRERIYEELVRG